MKPIPSLLIVDDAFFVRKLLHHTLAPLAEEIHEAGSVDEALVCARRYCPTLVTLDLTLDTETPVAGLQLIEEIRAVSPASRIVVVSALDQEWIRRDAECRGAEGYVVKPFVTDELRDVVLACREES